MLIERIDQLMHTVEQLLMLSRAGQALAGGHYQQLQWQKDIMQPLQPEMAELYEQRQQTQQWPNGKDIPQQGEAVLLRLMLRNLLENASRYSPEGSEVKVKMQQDKQQVMIEVWDQGPGIEADAAEELTQAFRRRDQRYGGSGLGLNIVLRIVQMHRGRLELVNRKDSSGLIARCYLPHQLL